MKFKHLFIIPYKYENLKFASYDISPTIIAMSIKTGMLENVYCDKDTPGKYHIYVKANDTVLIVSKEYLVLPNNVAGYVVSRVSKVSEGFGHVSTSIDPSWNGALLIGLSNPTNKSIKVYVGGNGKTQKNDSLATVSFHYINTPYSNKESKYEGMRLDLLKKMKYSDSDRKGIKTFLQNLFFVRRKKFTNFFFSYCDSHEINSKTWSSIVKDFQGLPKLNECPSCDKFVENKRRKSCFSDYIIKENIFLNLINSFFVYWEAIRNFIIIILIILALIKGWEVDFTKF